MKKRWKVFLGSLLAGIVLGLYLKRSATLTDWTGSLRDALSGATRLRIRSGGICHRDITQEKTLLDITDAAKIQELIETINIDKNGSNFHCMCCGNPTLEFYSGDKLIVELGFHHGRSLRWSRGRWPGDALLMKESGTAIIHWMEMNGVTGPRDEVKESEKRQEQSRVSLDRWNEAAPSCLRGEWEKVGFTNEDEAVKALNLKFADAVPDKSERILQLVNWFGAGEGPWSGFPAYESIPEMLLRHYQTEDILAAIQKKTLSEQQTEGVGTIFRRLAFFCVSPGRLEVIACRSKEAFT